MTTTTITLDCTIRTVIVDSDRMAVGHATFGNLCRAAGMGDLAVLSQVHIDRADDDFAALDALDDSLRDRARAAGDFAVGERVWLLLPGEGFNGCAVWARGTIDE